MHVVGSACTSSPAQPGTWVAARNPTDHRLGAAVKVRDVIRILERNGFQFIRQKGSHRRFRGMVDERIELVTVSGANGDDVPRGTLRSIKRQSGLPHDLFR